MGTQYLALMHSGCYAAKRPLLSYRPHTVVFCHMLWYTLSAACQGQRLANRHTW